MEEHTIKLTTTQAKKLYKENDSYRDTLLSNFTDIQLGIDNRPKAFKDLNEMKGYYINSDGDILSISRRCFSSERHKNVFASEKQAKSSLAYSQLSQLVKHLNDDQDQEDCIDWNDESTPKYTIDRLGNELVEQYYWTSYTPLAFIRKEDRDFSLKHHKQLWLGFYMLDEVTDNE